MDDALRSALIEELAKARHGYGLAASFEGEAQDRTPSCGDEVTVRVSGGSFTWEGHGCVVSTAAASALGMHSVAEFREVADAYLASVAADGTPVPGTLEPFATIGRFPLRARCATLAWVAARRALAATAASAG